MEIVVGTQNPGKLREYEGLLDAAHVTLIGLDEVGLGDMDVEETGETFEENAQLKALAYAQASGKWALADDSGLCVDALNGEPGVYSARYAGPGATDADRRRKLLDVLRDVPDEARTARFECAIALADPATGKVTTVRGTVEGVISRTESSGTHGFGYDHVFIPEGYTVTFADIPKAEKNGISHRGRAAAKLVPILQAMTGV